MESEKVKEIKEKLQNCGTPSFWDVSSQALTIINELESENERLNKALVDNLEAYKDGFNEGAGLKKGVDDKLKTENQQLKDRIAELEHKCGDCAGCTQWKCDCANIRDDVLTQFVETLKELQGENNNE